MNQIHLLLKGILPVFYLLLLVSCEKDDNAPPPVWSEGGSGFFASMTCKVEGQEWTAANNMAFATVGDNVANVTGVNSSNSSITITVMEPIVENQSYDLGFGSGNAAAYTESSDGSPAWTSNGNETTGGNVFISEVDTANKRISGTFQFVGIRSFDNSTRTISEGVFVNLSYSGTNPEPSANTFKVDLDSVPFNPTSLYAGIVFSKLQITASKSQGLPSVVLVMPTDVVEGTYEMGSTSSDFGGQYNISFTTFAMGNGGSMTISNHDKDAKLI